jgi:hypothetical protein
MRVLWRALLFSLLSSIAVAQNVTGGGTGSVTSLSSGAITNPTATLTLPTRSNMNSGAQSVTAATPCVFTWTGNPAVLGQSVVLTGTTAPGTGLFVNGTAYYVTNILTNSVQLASTRALAIGGTGLACPTNAGVSETLTLTYQPGEIIANSTTAVSVASNPFVIATSGGAAVAPYCVLQTSALWGGTLVQVNFWKAQPTYTNGDLQPYAVATGSANYIGTMSGTFTAFGDGSATAMYPSPQVALLLKPSSAANIYWDVQAVTTGIPVSAQTLTITCGLMN